MEKDIGMLQSGISSLCMSFLCRAIETYTGFKTPNGLTGFFTVLGAGCLYWYYSTKSKFTTVFKNLGLGTNGICYPLLKSQEKTENSVIYKFTLPAGLCLDDFLENKQAIEQHIGHEIDIRYEDKGIVIEEYTQKVKTMYPYLPVDIKGNVPILIGYDRKDNIISCDLSTGEPHLLIGGETGSGKSTVLRSIITNLILKSKVQLHLVDLKSGTEFNVFRKSNRVKDFCRTISETEQLLIQMSSEVDRRYNMFYELDVKDIADYNTKFPRRKLPYDVIIIDEFADLQDNKECKACLDELGRKARACGIHMILSTQRPDSKVLTGSIKANITSIIGLKTLNSTNSNIIISEPILSNLRGNGHGIFKRGGKTEFQAPFLEVDRCRELIKNTYTNKAKEQAKAETIKVAELDVFK